MTTDTKCPRHRAAMASPSIVEHWMANDTVAFTRQLGLQASPA